MEFLFRPSNFGGALGAIWRCTSIGKKNSTVSIQFDRIATM